MKPLVACVAALAFVLAWGLFAQSAEALPSAPGITVRQHPVPLKKTPRPKPSPSVSPTTAEPSMAPRPRSAAEIEGDRWVQLAMFGGGGLLGAVLVFFAVGALIRRPRRRPRRQPRS